MSDSPVAKQIIGFVANAGKSPSVNATAATAWEATQNALVAYGGTTRSDGRAVAGSEILSELTRKNVWFLLRPSRVVKAGCGLLFYQTRAGFTAYGRVTGVREISASDAGLLARLGLDYFKIRVDLTEVRRFTKTIPLRENLQQLEFITNKLYWGQSFRNTPRSIGFSDVHKILSLSVGDVKVN